MLGDTQNERAAVKRLLVCLVALLAVVAVLAGCGSRTKPVEDAADLAPRTTPTFVVLKTRLALPPETTKRTSTPGPSENTRRST